MPIMAISSSSPTFSPLKPRYVSPQNRTTHHSRRMSGTRRLSSSTTIPLFPNAESPRTLCPRDHVAFAYNPSHLKAWDMAQDMWNKLPSSLQTSIAAVQHAGAAVLTAFDRLEEAHCAVIQEENEDETTKEERHEDEKDNTQQCEAPPVLPPESTEGNKTRFHARQDSGFFMCAPHPPLTPPSSTSFQPSPSPLPSPLELASTSSSSHMFTTPSSPAASYYLAELSHLRSEALPRLRHSALRVDVDYHELKRLVAQLRKQGEVVEDADCLETFEEWWKGKKGLVVDLETRVKGGVGA